MRADRGRVAEARVLRLLPLSVYNSDLAAVVGRLWGGGGGPCTPHRAQADKAQVLSLVRRREP